MADAAHLHKHNQALLQCSMCWRESWKLCSSVACQIWAAVVQVAGLKHFDDMQQRIPRSEVEQVHSLVCGVVREVVGVEGLPDADRLHCRVTGSYIRGKPMTGCTALDVLYCQS